MRYQTDFGIKLFEKPSCVYVLDFDNSRPLKGAHAFLQILPTRTWWGACRYSASWPVAHGQKLESKRAPWIRGAMNLVLLRPTGFRMESQDIQIGNIGKGPRTSSQSHCQVLNVTLGNSTLCITLPWTTGVQVSVSHWRSRRHVPFEQGSHDKKAVVMVPPLGFARIQLVV